MQSPSPPAGWRICVSGPACRGPLRTGWPPGWKPIDYWPGMPTAAGCWGPPSASSRRMSTIPCCRRVPRCSPAARDHRRERPALPPRRHQPDLCCRSGTACRTAGYGAHRHPAADDCGLGRQGAAGLRRCGHPTGGAAVGDVHRPHLAEVRKRGWAQSAAEREAGVASVSAPVRDPAAPSSPQSRCRAPSTGWAGAPACAGQQTCWPPPKP